MLCGLPPFYVPVVMRVFYKYTPCPEESGVQRNQPQDNSPRIPLGPVISSTFHEKRATTDRQFLSLFVYPVSRILLKAKSRQFRSASCQYFEPVTVACRASPDSVIE